jgi:chromosome segregation ATPase
MKSAKERLHDAYPDGIATPGGGGVDYSVGLKALARAVDEVRRSLKEEVKALVDEMKKTATVSQVSKELADLEGRIESVEELANHVDEESVVSRRLDEMAEELKAVRKNRRRNTDRIGEVEEDLAEVEEAVGRLQDSLVDKARSIERLSQENEELDGRLESIREGQRRLSASMSKVAALMHELESRLADVERGMDMQDESRDDLRGTVGRLEKRITRLELKQRLGGDDADWIGAQEPAFRDSSQQDPSQKEQGDVEASSEGSPSEPSWHDRPPEPGVYVVAGGEEARVARVMAPAAIRVSDSESFYGPIPEEEAGLETLV